MLIRQMSYLLFLASFFFAGQQLKRLRFQGPPACCRADDWMSGAVDCLEFLPDELVVEVSRGLAGCADDLPQCKRLLYEVLAKHYGHTQQPPLFSNHVFDIHSGISELLGELRCR